MKTIYRAANITEAEILRGMLSAAGIDSHISGYYLQGGVGELAAADSVGIQVDEADISTAIAVLKEYDPEKESLNSFINKNKLKDFSLFRVGLEQFPFYKMVFAPLKNISFFLKTSSKCFKPSINFFFLF